MRPDRLGLGRWGGREGGREGGQGREGKGGCETGITKVPEVVVRPDRLGLGRWGGREGGRYVYVLDFMR